MSTRSHTDTDGLDPIRARLPRGWHAHEQPNRGSGARAVTVVGLPARAVLAAAVRHPNLLATGGYGQPAPAVLIEALARLPHARLNGEVATTRWPPRRRDLRLDVEDIATGPAPDPVALALLVPTGARAYLDGDPPLVGYVTPVPDPAPAPASGATALRLRLTAIRALLRHHAAPRADRAPRPGH